MIEERHNIHNILQETEENFDTLIKTELFVDIAKSIEEIVEDDEKIRFYQNNCFSFFRDYIQRNFREVSFEYLLKHFFGITLKEWFDGLDSTQSQSILRFVPDFKESPYQIQLKLYQEVVDKYDWFDSGYSWGSSTGGRFANVSEHLDKRYYSTKVNDLILRIIDSNTDFVFLDKNKMNSLIKSINLTKTIKI